MKITQQELNQALQVLEESLHLALKKALIKWGFVFAVVAVGGFVLLHTAIQEIVNPREHTAGYNQQNSATERCLERCLKVEK